MAEGSGPCLCSWGSLNDACWQKAQSALVGIDYNRANARARPPEEASLQCHSFQQLLSPARFKLRSTSVVTAMCQLTLCIVTRPVLVQVVLDALQRPGSGQSYVHLKKRLSSNVQLGTEGRRAAVKEETAIGMNQESNRLSALIN